MGKIVKFPIERTNLKQTSSAVGSADIIIFPGVRIERREFNLADRHPGSSLAGNRQAVAKDV